MKLQFGNNIFLTILFSCITAVGGGTVRDLILKKQVFWIKNPYNILLTIISSLITYKLYKPTNI